MRIGLITSVIIHGAVFLWIMVAPGEKPFDAARADPVLVDLVSPKDVPLAEPPPEPAKPEMAKPAVPALEPPEAALKTAPVKPAPLKSAPRSTEAPKPERPKPEPPKPVREADLKPTPKPAPAPAPITAAAPSVEDQAAAASRFAWMLDLPTAWLTGAGGGLPSESGSRLTSTEIAKFKARVSQCWVAPDVPAAGLNALIRVSLKPDGALLAEPELVLGPDSKLGPLLVESAKRALQQCQPYDFLPADTYQDWKVLELGFSVDGPSDNFRTPALDGTSLR